MRHIAEIATAHCFPLRAPNPALPHTVASWREAWLGGRLADSAASGAKPAIDAASKHYSLRLIELRDGINVPEQTRNEQLYRAAMEEAISSSDKLRTASERWDQEAMPPRPPPSRNSDTIAA